MGQHVFGTKSQQISYIISFAKNVGVFFVFAIANNFAGWWFETFFLFSHILGVIIPIDVHIFQRGSNHQPVCRLQSLH